MDRWVTGSRGVLLVLGALVVIAAGLGAWGVFAQPQSPPDDGLAFAERADDAGLDYQFDGRQVVNGNPGVYVTDYNNDGWQDLLLVGNESRGPVLFENTGTGFAPAEVIPDAVRDDRIHSAFFVDVDNDGWEDLLLLPDPQQPAGGYTQSSGAPGFSENTSHPLVLKNDNGTFAEPTVLDEIALQPYSIGATAADYDQDGCLDVFIYQNGAWSERTPAGYRNPSTIGNITDDNGEGNLLLRGDCSGDFTDVTAEAGITGDRWSLAASFVDLTGDGRPDIHVANDFNRDTLHVNQGHGTFDTRPLPGTDRNGMSSEVADFDGDGRPDIFVTNIGMASRDGADLSQESGGMFDRQATAESPRFAKGNQLLVNQGNGTFTDRAGDYGVQNAPYVWGWAAVAADLDGDGDLDLVHTNNEKSSITSEGGHTMMRWSNTAPAVWENVGTATSPSYVHRPAHEVGLQDMNARGIARLDYDRDGDPDLVAADADDTVKLYENRGEPAHWLQIELGKSRSAGTVGATVAVTTGNQTQYRFANARGDFLSQEDRVVHLGLGEARTVDQVVVTWSDGSRTTIEEVHHNQRLRTHENGTVERIPTSGRWIDIDAEG